MFKVDNTTGELSERLSVETDPAFYPDEISTGVTYAVIARAVQSGADTRINFFDGQDVSIEDFQRADLDASDFSL